MGRFLGFIFVLAGLAVVFLALTKPEKMPYDPQIFLFLGIVIAFGGAIYFKYGGSLRQPYHPVYR